MKTIGTPASHTTIVFHIVIGTGMSGLYSTRRLPRRKPKLHIKVLEMLDRTGVRRFTSGELKRSPATWSELYHRRDAAKTKGAYGHDCTRTCNATDREVHGRDTCG